MKRLIFVLILLSLNTSLVSCIDSDLFESCKQLEAEEKITDAITCYKSLIESKDSTAAYERLSIIYGKRGEYEDAITFGKRVFAANQQNLSNKMNLGDWYYKIDEADHALNYFLMVERVDSLYPGLNYNLSVVYLTKFNAPQLARKHIERELVTFGYSEENYALMGQIYFQLNLYEKSEIAYSRVITENPNNATYYFQRAILYYYWDRYSEAITDLNAAMKMEPKFVDAMLLKIDIGIELNASFVCDLLFEVEKYSTLSEDLLKLRNECLQR